jgi:hypothetical protein
MKKTRKKISTLTLLSSTRWKWSTVGKKKGGEAPGTVMMKASKEFPATRSATDHESHAMDFDSSAGFPFSASRDLKKKKNLEDLSDRKMKTSSINDTNLQRAI